MIVLIKPSVFSGDGENPTLDKVRDDVGILREQMTQENKPQPESRMEKDVAFIKDLLTREPEPKKSFIARAKDWLRRKK
jgi:hypothetical protein